MMHVAHHTDADTVVNFDPTTTERGVIHPRFLASPEKAAKSCEIDPPASNYFNRVTSWIRRQLESNNNRHALQVSSAFVFASLFVVITPISSVLSNAFWIGVSVVTVLDNTVGGFLNLSIQRMIGTILGGAASMVVMTISRALFPVWNWRGIVLLCSLMFLQVFFIAKVKLLPNMSYAGGIGLLTTVIILLSGYPELIQDKLSAVARLAAWRIMNLVVGIFIAMLASLCIFPLKATHTMRRNLGTAMNDAADLYKSVASFCLDLENSTSAVNESLVKSSAADRPVQSTLTRMISRTFSTQPEAILVDSENENHNNIDDLCNKALAILTRLQVESTRLRNVANEYYLEKPFHLLFHGMRYHDHSVRRAKRYSDAIDAMKRIVWPLVSFRLLLPLRSLNTDGHHNRTALTKVTLENFGDALRIMRRLGEMLKDNQRPLSEYPDWYLLERAVSKGHMHITNELQQTLQMDTLSDMDGVKLLAYYGFLVRCSMIWEGLKVVVEKLGPQVSSRRSSRVILPVRDPVIAQG